MTDTLTPAERSKCMAAVHSRNTKPEMCVRKFLFAKGLRYRLHSRKLPGTPDLVFPKYKAVIFVNGCFWHGHRDCRQARLPKSNVQFWETKIARNKARDRQTIESLEAQGWRVFVVWECQLRQAEQRKNELNNLYLKIISHI